MSAREGAGRREGPLAIAILASGAGTTLAALADRIAAGTLPARIALAVVDRPGAGALEQARRRGLPLELLPSRGIPPEIWAARLSDALTDRAVELVVLAGFLTILPPSWVERWAGRAINLHPALLPRYGGPGMYGARVHEAVLAAGDRETGATVHLVTTHVDGGPILAQARIDVVAGDTPETLRAKLHPVEVEVLASAIGRFAAGEWPLPYPGPERSASSRRDASGRAA